MSITSVQAWQAFGSGTSVAITFGATATSGNMLLTFMTKDDDVLATGPAGWTEAYGFTSNAQIAMQCWWKISDGTETGLTITGDSEVYAVYGLELNGIDPVDPIISNAGQTVNISDLAAVSISATLSDNVPVLLVTQIGVDRNTTFGTWTNGTGIEPIEYFRHEGSGAGDVSQWVGGIFYDPNAPTVTRFFSLSAVEEWGVRGVYITPPLATPVISLPTGTPETLTPLTAQITSAGFTTDVAQGRAYWYLSASSSPPAAATLKLGSGSIQSGSQSVTVTGALTFATITGLTPNTSYFLHYIHENAVKDSNILTINVSTPPFTVSLDFRSINARYYTGAQVYYKTTYQNSGTAWGVLTNSATPPTPAQIIAGTAPGQIDQASDTSWTVSADPNIFLQYINQAQGGITVFENTTYYTHALIDDPANSAQSDIVTQAITTLQRFTVGNVVVTDSTIDSADFTFDITINESTSPRVTFILNQSPTPLTGDDIRNGVWDFDTGDVVHTAADQTVPISATGLTPLTVYYVHITWWDAGNADYLDDVYWPVLSPAVSVATALSTEALVLATNKALVINDPLEYAFVRFGQPGRNVNGKTEALVLTANQASVDQGRNVTTIAEALILTENTANVTQGGAARDVNAATELLRLTTNAATVGKGQTANGVTEQLVLTANQATVVKDRPVPTTTEALVLTANQATVVKTVLREVVGTTEQLVVATTQADIFRGRNRTVVMPTVPLFWRDNNATIQRDREVFAPAGNQFLLTVNPAVVGKGQTANGVTEQLVFQSTPSTIRRDRLVETDPEAEIKILIVAKAVIGRGHTVRTAVEPLVMEVNRATIKRGVTLRPDSEALVLTANPAKVGKGVTVTGNTEQIVLAATAAVIGKTTDRRVTTATEQLQLQTNTTVVSAGRDVAGASESLVLKVARADVRQVRRSVGGGLEFADRVGVELIAPTVAVRILSPTPDDVTVLTPATDEFRGCC